MPYEFFFSYTRANNDVYLKQFFDDLCVEIRAKRGLPQDADVGFFDQRDLELGEDWDTAIVYALQNSNVVIAVGSPGYFKREYCGKEWELFRQRCAATIAPGASLPPLMKTIIWVPFEFGDVPPAVGVGQLVFGDPHAIYNTKGFRYLLKQLQEYKTQYNDLIDKLAQEIIDAGDEYPLNELLFVPKLRDVVPAFPLSVMEQGGVSPVPSPSGPKHVRFVYVAADPQAFGDARTKDPYMDAGGADWKPFFPDDKRRVHLFLQHFVTSDELGFTSDELVFGPNLIAEIGNAWHRRQIVIVIVDGWSLDWNGNAQYRSILSQLDGRLDYHWCVLVPWNDKDQYLVENKTTIGKTVSVTFDRHKNLAPNPMFFRDDIKSADELGLALRDVLTRLKEEIKKRASVEMPVPPGPSKSIITGPSGTG